MSVSYYGELFSGRNKVTPAIATASRRTATYAEALLRVRSPVKTGRYRAAWSVSPENRGLRISNPVPYAIYLEMGTRFMEARATMARSMPDIRAKFQAELAKEVGKNLGASIVAQVDKTLGYDRITGQSEPKQTAKPQAYYRGFQK